MNDTNDLYDLSHYLYDSTDGNSITALRTSFYKWKKARTAS
jgi:hypothetical protein